MINLIIADLRRVLRKKNFWMVPGVAALISVISIIFERFSYFNGLKYAFNRQADLTGYIALFVGIVTFIGIYADEFSAKSFQTAIGRGIQRHKIIAVKLINCTVLSCLVFLCFWVLFCVLGVITGAKMDIGEYKVITLACVCAAYTVICAAPLAAVVLFATENTALSIFIELLLIAVIPMVLTLLDQMPAVYNSHISMYYITGIANGFFADMMLYGGGVGRLLLGAVVYLGIAYILTVLVFCKKELEF